MSDFGAAWARLLALLPDTATVRFTLRRKNGQWLCQVGDIRRTGTSDLDALQRVLEAYEQERDDDRAITQ